MSPETPPPLSCRPTTAGDRLRWRVWAPRARSVELVLFSGERSAPHDMTRAAWGYFVAELPVVPEGQRYAYRLDDGPPRPDPCSLWQPEGVHRSSAIFYPERYTWTDQAWHGIPRQDLVFYELHVGTFTSEGTFEAIIPRLAALRELGVTALEIMPVAQFPGGRNWGYDGVHPFAPQSSYGGPRSLMRLIDAAHAHGLAVFLDVVYNHFGPEGNYVGEFGPYYSDRYRTPWGPAFNFDGRDCDAVRDFVLDNVWYWIHDFHLDGLRLDAVHAMFDISPRHILRDIKEVADAAANVHGRQAQIVVESLLNDVRMVLPPERGGHGLDAEWNEDFHHAALAYLTGERRGKYVDFGSAEQLATVLKQTFLLSGGYSQFRGRRWGGPAHGLPGNRFIIGIQNHDHVGNRAWGERLAVLVSPDVQRMAACLTLLAAHLPFLFMGEEYGERNPFLFFSSFEDQALAEAVRSGRRRDYALTGEVPDPQAESSFTASRLSWSWPDQSTQAGLRRLYRDLLLARQSWPALQEWTDRDVSLRPGAESAAILELIRGAKKADSSRTVTCLFNLTGQPQRVPQGIPERQLPLFSSQAEAYRGATEPRLPSGIDLLPYECRVYGPPDWRTFPGGRPD